MSASSCGNQLSPSGFSTEMISDGCTDANCKVQVKRVREHLLPAAQPLGALVVGPTVAARGTRNGHIDLFCHVTPGQALATQLHDLIGCGGMCAQGDGAARYRPRGCRQLCAPNCIHAFRDHLARWCKKAVLPASVTCADMSTGCAAASTLTDCTMSTGHFVMRSWTAENHDRLSTRRYSVVHRECNRPQGSMSPP